MGGGQRRGSGGWGAQLHRHAAMALDAQPVGFGGWMTEPIVADRVHALRQDMAQVAAYPFDSRQRQLLALIVIAILPAESDRLVVDRDDALIADSRARDIGAQILQGGNARSDGLDMHVPLLGPDDRIDRPVVVL